MVAPYTTSRHKKVFSCTTRRLPNRLAFPSVSITFRRTGKNIEPETIARMAELPNITLVKEATGSLDQASQILCTTD